MALIMLKEKKTFESAKSDFHQPARLSGNRPPLDGAGRHDGGAADARARVRAQSWECKQLFDAVILTSAGSLRSPVALTVGS